MANPQLENGFTRIANELFEAIYKAKLTGNQHNFIDMVIRHTYGYHKKESAITQEMITQELGYKNKGYISRLSDSLVDMNVLHKTEERGKPTIYSLNKNYEDWETNTPTSVIDSRVKYYTPECISSITLPSVSGITPTGVETNTPTSVNIIKKDKDNYKEKNKESKIFYSDKVSFTEIEYNKLIERFGESVVKSFIEKIDNWKHLNKKNKYDSDYHAVINWIARDKERNNGSNIPTGNINGYVDMNI
jgi:phage replication O-like protein O